MCFLRVKLLEIFFMDAICIQVFLFRSIKFPAPFMADWWKLYADLLLSKWFHRKKQELNWIVDGLFVYLVENKQENTFRKTKLKQVEEKWKNKTSAKASQKEQKERVKSLMIIGGIKCKDI